MLQISIYEAASKRTAQPSLYIPSPTNTIDACPRAWFDISIPPLATMELWGRENGETACDHLAIFARLEHDC